MTESPSPGDPQEVVSRLEDDIVDVERAASGDEEGAEDAVGTVPGAPEPPD